MLVFVEEPAESVAAADSEARDRGRLGDRVWQRVQRPGVRDSPMWTMRVVMPLVLAQGVYEMCLAWRRIDRATLSSKGRSYLEELEREFERVRAALGDYRAYRAARLRAEQSPSTVEREARPA